MTQEPLQHLFLSSLLASTGAPRMGGPPVTDAMVAHAEERLGYKLPDAYLSVLRYQNGGVLRRSVFRPISNTLGDRGSIVTHFWVYELYGIGGERGIDVRSSIESDLCLSEFLVDQWNFPKVGVVIGYSGHAGYLLDYSQCGRQGEPAVIYADSEDPTRVKVFPVAPSFAEFYEGLTEYDENGGSRWEGLLSHSPPQNA